MGAELAAIKSIGVEEIEIPPDRSEYARWTAALVISTADGDFRLPSHGPVRERRSRDGLEKFTSALVAAIHMREPIVTSNMSWTTGQEGCSPDPLDARPGHNRGELRSTQRTA